jgi:PIN domain nuclease of toxin-antitoxin system
MTSVVADTHAIVWLLHNDSRLPATAVAAMDKAERIIVPSICLVEIAYLVEKGKLHEATLPRLLAELDLPTTTLRLASLDIGVVRSLNAITRNAVPDMPDRIIAATAWHNGIPLITRDRKIRSCGIETIW